MARTAWTRVWTMMPRECGVQTSSRASRRRWRSTHPAAGGKSSSQMRARCTVSAGGGVEAELSNLLPQTHAGVSPWSIPQARKQLAGVRPGAGLGWGGAGDLCPSLPGALCPSLPLPPSLGPAGPTGLVRPWGRERARDCGARAAPALLLPCASTHLPKAPPTGPGGQSTLWQGSPTHPSHPRPAQLLVISLLSPTGGTILECQPRSWCLPKLLSLPGEGLVPHALHIP